AWSGGWLWIPKNPLAVEAGITEDQSEPLKYVETVMGQAPDARVSAFLDQGPKMVEFFRDKTDVDFIDGNLVPDFHPCEGHALGGRSVAAAPFDGRKLGKDIHRLRRPLSVISLFGMGIASGADIRHFFNATRSLSSMMYVCKRIGRHIRDLVLFQRGMQLVNGNALIGALFSTANKLNVSIQTDASVSRLLEENGKVTGVEFICDGRKHTVFAKQGVVLAAGGFPHDKNRFGTHLPSKAGTEHYSAAPLGNTGDGLRVAEQVGAKVADDLADPFAWSPVSRVPTKDGGFIHFPHLIERAKPGIIAVLPNGERFTSEADSYHDFMKALFDASPKGKQPYCWLIADHKAQRRWGLGWSRPFPFPLSGYIRSGYLKKGRNIIELADQIGVPRGALSKTLEVFNSDVAKGVDTQFHRGESPYNRIQGDLDSEGNPSLGALDQAPFYAVKIEAGSLGTFAGIRTNEKAEVLDGEGKTISGLYAVGNDMSSIFNGAYPSGGITLGPAMTFGYIIGNQLGKV
ncbi:MAG: FAD-binding protein, partial [Pontibacterium sp.]